MIYKWAKLQFVLYTHTSRFDAQISFILCSSFSILKPHNILYIILRDFSVSIPKNVNT